MVGGGRALGLRSHPADLDPVPLSEPGQPPQLARGVHPSPGVHTEGILRLSIAPLTFRLQAMWHWDSLLRKAWRSLWFPPEVGATPKPPTSRQPTPRLRVGGGWDGADNLQRLCHCGTPVLFPGLLPRLTTVWSDPHQDVA